VIGRREKVRFKKKFKSNKTRLSDERMCRVERIPIDYSLERQQKIKRREEQEEDDSIVDRNIL